jgi:hypothetical protein
MSRSNKRAHVRSARIRAARASSPDACASPSSHSSAILAGSALNVDASEYRTSHRSIPRGSRPATHSGLRGRARRHRRSGEGSRHEAGVYASRPSSEPIARPQTRTAPRRSRPRHAQTPARPRDRVRRQRRRPGRPRRVQGDGHAPPRRRYIAPRLSGSSHSRSYRSSRNTCLGSNPASTPAAARSVANRPTRSPRNRRTPPHHHPADAGTPGPHRVPTLVRSAPRQPCAPRLSRPDAINARRSKPRPERRAPGPARLRGRRLRPATRAERVRALITAGCRGVWPTDTQRR